MNSSLQRHDPPSASAPPARRAGESAPAADGGVIGRLYRCVGLAAIAGELRIPLETCDRELRECVERGAIYLAR